jgi:suppressor of ftsI
MTRVNHSSAWLGPTAALGWLLLAAALSGQSPGAGDTAVLVANPPAARSPLTLLAINDSQTGLASFQFDGHEDPPAIFTAPGATLRITYENAMSMHSQELCVDGPCTNMSNLHFHGLHVSPDSPQDDVITMMTMPGKSIRYAVEIPQDQPPGLYFYHTHPHGESYQQSLDGMSGAIVIEGISRYYPQVANLPERVLVLRDRVVGEKSPLADALRKRVGISNEPCGSAPGTPERLFTVNGLLRPQIAISPGERQLWRIVNASPDLYANLQLDRQSIEVVALDGMPLSFHAQQRKPEFRDEILIPPAGRVEAIVTGPKPGEHTSLRTTCFDTGPDGDPNPAMVLADLVNLPAAAVALPKVPIDGAPPVYKNLPTVRLAGLEQSPTQFVVVFTEDKNGFYINDKKYLPDGSPMVTVNIGGYRHWQVLNKTHEVHPFHIHQVHFLVYRQNGTKIPQPEWLDTVNVPVEGSLDVIMDFTDPIIRGMSVFHCHLLKHEDKGMMAKVLFR